MRKYFMGLLPLGLVLSWAGICGAKMYSPEVVTVLMKYRVE